jgi:hypothetical protein
LKKLNAEFFLELPDLLAQRRLTDIQPQSGAAEMQFFGYGDQIAQVAQFHDKPPPKVLNLSSFGTANSNTFL